MLSWSYPSLPMPPRICSIHLFFFCSVLISSTVPSSVSSGNTSCVQLSWLPRLIHLLQTLSFPSICKSPIAGGTVSLRRYRSYIVVDVWRERPKPYLDSRILAKVFPRIFPSLTVDPDRMIPGQARPCVLGFPRVAIDPVPGQESPILSLQSSGASQTSTRHFHLWSNV